MGCNSCGKGGSSVKFSDNGNDYKISIVGGLIYFIIAAFVSTLVLIPVIWVIGMYMLFKTMVLNKSTELLPSLAYFGKLFIDKNKENDDIDEINDEDFDPNDYELVDVEEIK